MVYMAVGPPISLITPLNPGLLTITTSLRTLASNVTSHLFLDVVKAQKEHPPEQPFTEIEPAIL